MIRASDVARYFLSRSKLNSETAITHLKLQKLVYYAQAWHLALTEGPLFRERIEAWIHGPVCPDLYYEYRKHGFSEIAPTSPPNNLTTQQINILEAVWQAYGSYDGNYLEELTHKEEPWKKARAGLNGLERSSNEIDHKSMADYYGNRNA